MDKSLQLMTIGDFHSLLSGPRAEYYAGRWAYYSEVIRLIEAEAPASTIELGPGHLPIIKNGDVILNPLHDQFGQPDAARGREYVFDATARPWPIADKSYDLFIALQVWEHLDNKQPRAFREVMRIARKAILSFPYHWDGGEEKPSHRAHRDIDLELIRDWTLNVEPVRTIEIVRTGPEFSKGPRLICLWDFTR